MREYYVTPVLQFLESGRRGAGHAPREARRNATTIGRSRGTNVYDRGGNNIGEVKDIVLEKTSNNIMFAVVDAQRRLVGLC